MRLGRNWAGTLMAILVWYMFPFYIELAKFASDLNNWFLGDFFFKFLFLVLVTQPPSPTDRACVKGMISNRHCLSSSSSYPTQPLPIAIPSAWCVSCCTSSVSTINVSYHSPLRPPPLPSSLHTTVKTMRCTKIPKKLHHHWRNHL